MDSWSGLCDLGLILFPLSLIFLIWNLGLFSPPPAPLKADVNGDGSGRREGRREKREGDQNLLDCAKLMIWKVGVRGWRWGRGPGARAAEAGRFKGWGGEEVAS